MLFFIRSKVELMRFPHECFYFLCSYLSYGADCIGSGFVFLCRALDLF